MVDLVRYERFLRCYFFSDTLYFIVRDFFIFLKGIRELFLVSPLIDNYLHRRGTKMNVILETERLMTNIKNLPRQSYTDMRRELLSLLDGECFFPLKSWPMSIKRRFFKKPNSDQDTLVLILFFYG